MFKKRFLGFNFYSLRWRISLAFFSVITVGLLVLALFLAAYVKDIYLQNLEERLVSEARLAAARFSSPEITLASIQATVTQTSQLTGTRVTVIRQDGKVLADSEADPTTLENHSSRPEFQAVLQNPATYGKATRLSVSVHVEELYIAVVTPTVPGSALGGTVTRLALPLVGISAALNSIWLTFGIATGAVAILALVVGQWQLSRLVRPLRGVVRAARILGQGDFTVRVEPSSYHEFSAIGNTFNTMAARLEELVGDLEEERQMLQAVLDNMGDGVLSLDADTRLLSLNQAARRLLRLPGSPQILGQTLMTVTRDHELYQLLQQAQQTGHPVTQLLETPYRSYSLQVTAIPWTPDQPGRALLILRDLTELRRVERVRRDFVANISHELRTPLAAIKVMSETVEMVLEEDPDTARQMVNRINSEVDHLTLLVKDLLGLATLQSGKANFEFASVDIKTVLNEVLSSLRPLTEQKEQKLTLEIGPDLPDIVMDREKIATALRNLIQNAIKFTSKGGSISIKAALELDSGNHGAEAAPATAEWVKISVKDTGIGLSKEEQQRVFERFYKVDPSRSGESGSGLGLAITRHIIQGHHGAIWVDSVPGQGATFSFTLPLKQPQPSNYSLLV
jgi:two-component system phosphate regulon sensor histidine kinase PhoR